MSTSSWSTAAETPVKKIRSKPSARGWVAQGFENVRVEFERNFAERGEIGAAVSAYWRGEKVVDLWGGRRSPDGNAPWSEDTMVLVNSTTKGVSAMTVAVANARGWLDYEARVARYWPEFAQAGKSAITVRQLLGHEAGLAWLDEKLSIKRLRDLDGIARLLARRNRRGRRHAAQLPRDDDRALHAGDRSPRRPAHRTSAASSVKRSPNPGSRSPHRLAPEIPARRLATMMPLPRAGASRPGEAALAVPPPGALAWSLLRRSMLFNDIDWNDRRCLEVEVPAGRYRHRPRSPSSTRCSPRAGPSYVGPETMAKLTAAPTAAARRTWSWVCRAVTPWASSGRGGRVLRLSRARSARRAPAAVRFRRSGCAARLRLRHEQDGLLHVRRSAGEGAP